MGDLVETVVDIAATLIKKKAEKKNTKKKRKMEKKLEESSIPFEIVNEIEEGKNSSLLRSLMDGRSEERRLGVMARNETERSLVRVTTSVLMRKTMMEEYAL